jgi:hypothetical protein
MGRNLLIVSALAAVLFGFGVVTGASVGGPDAAVAPEVEPRLLRAEGEPTLSGAAEPARLLEHSLDREILARLTQLEAAIARQAEQYESMAKRMEPAAEIIQMINEQRARRGTARPMANETAAIATSRNVISAQAQLQASARVDTDQDGTGEYGGFLEMAGAVAGRMSKPLVPPVLSSAFRMITDQGEAQRSGYLYKIYLPTSRGDGVDEGKTGFQPGDVSADLAETTWCMYAWPETHGQSGARTFFVNQAGDVLSTEDPEYSGSGNGPAFDAAFKEASMLGKTANGSEGRDGNVWKQAN